MKMNNLSFLEDILRDTRLALRQLSKAPGFTLTAVLTLALGIGIATALFVVVYGVLLQPLPFSNPHQLYRPVGIDTKAQENFAFPYISIEQWQEAAKQSAQ